MAVLGRRTGGFSFPAHLYLYLLFFIDNFKDIISKGNVVDTIYFDFAKAFDSVTHKRLLYKLNTYSITGNTFEWIKSFLIGRK